MPRFHKNLTNKGYDLSTITGHQVICVNLDNLRHLRAKELVTGLISWFRGYVSR